MSPARATVPEDARLRALVLLQGYSLGLNAVAETTLENHATDNSDIQILVAVHAVHGVSPSDLVQALGKPRSTVSRGLARLLEWQLVERRTGGPDRRRAQLSLTPKGRRRVERFERALADFFLDGEPVVKEVQLLLGRDPERHRPRGRRVQVLEVADRMGAAGAAYVGDVLTAMRPYGLRESADRYAVVLLALGESRPCQLAEHLGLSPAGTTNLVERLEGLQLVERESGGLDADRRAVLVRLTPRGRRAAEGVLEVFRRHQDPLLDALAQTLGATSVSSA